MSLDYRFCVAPMMKKTDRHFRYLSRQFSKKAVLYTEMIHANAILKGNPEKLLQYKDIEHPVALQLGGVNHHNLLKQQKLVLAMDMMKLISMLVVHQKKLDLEILEFS